MGILKCEHMAMMAEGEAQAELLAVAQCDYQQLVDYIRSKGTWTEMLNCLKRRMYTSGELAFLLCKQLLP